MQNKSNALMSMLYMQRNVNNTFVCIYVKVPLFGVNVTISSQYFG